MSSVARPEQYFRLSEFLMRHLDRTRWPRQAEFVAWCREAGVRNAHKSYAQLRRGGAVTRSAAEAFINLLRHHGMTPPAITDFLVPSIEPPTDRGGPWEGPNSVIDTLFGTFKETAANFVNDPAAEIPAIARDIVEYAGRMKPDSRGATDLLRGEGVMGRRVDEYAAWLDVLVRRLPHAVMYGTTSARRRVAVSVIVPVTEWACEELCQGRLSDRDIGPAHTDPQSRFLFTNAVVPFGDQAGLSHGERDRAEVHSVFRQTAYFTRLADGQYRPVSVTFAGNRFVGDRLRRLGYRYTGHNLRGTDKPMLVLRHKAEIFDLPKPTARDRFTYNVMRLAFRGYRLVIGRDWRDEDRDRSRGDG